MDVKNLNLKRPNIKSFGDFIKDAYVVESLLYGSKKAFLSRDEANAYYDKQINEEVKMRIKKIDELETFLTEKEYADFLERHKGNILCSKNSVQS